MTNPLGALVASHGATPLPRGPEPWMPKEGDPVLQVLRNHFPRGWKHGLAIGSLVVHITDDQADAIEKQLKKE